MFDDHKVIGVYPPWVEYEIFGTKAIALGLILQRYGLSKETWFRALARRYYVPGFAAITELDKSKARLGCNQELYIYFLSI